jgi:hypothetical protein
MVVALDISSANAVLKEYYSNQRVEALMYKDAPLYALMPKIKDFYGRLYPLPMRVTNPQGRAGTFVNAQNQKSTSLYNEFTLTRAKNYSLASISSEAIMASESSAGAFLRLSVGEIDGALDSLKRSLAWSIYGDGSGTLGAVASVTSANPCVVTLTNAEDIVRFEVNQTVEIRSGATVRTLGAANPASAVITAVDRDNGKITLNVDNSGAGSQAVANDTINVVGDYGVLLTGLQGWIPSTSPTSSTFFNVNRTVDPTRLGGVRVTGTGKPMDECLVDAARRLGREGGSPDYAFMSFGKYSTLEKTLGSRVVYDDVEVGGIGFRSIKISGPSKPIQVLADRDCPDAQGYLLTLDTWGFYSLKEPVQILDLDGNKMLRDGSSDSYEVRCATYSQVGCTMPGANAVITF